VNGAAPAGSGMYVTQALEFRTEHFPPRLRRRFGGHVRAPSRLVEQPPRRSAGRPAVKASSHYRSPHLHAKNGQPAAATRRALSASQTPRAFMPASGRGASAWKWLLGKVSQFELPPRLGSIQPSCTSRFLSFRKLSSRVCRSAAESAGRHRGQNRRTASYALRAFS
jgi:hypothetical protein